MGLFDFFKKKKPQPQVNPDLNRTLMDVVHKIGNTNTGRYLLIPGDSRPPIPVILGHPC